MSQQNKPPAGETAPAGGPTHHHVPPAHTPGVATPITPADTEVRPEDLKIPQVADYMLGRLPDQLVEDQAHHPKAAPKSPDKPVEVRPKEVVVTENLALLNKGFVSTPETLPMAMDRTLDLWVLLNEINREAVRENMPFNRNQVRPGAYAVLRAALDGSADTMSMRVDIDLLGKDVGALERVLGMRTIIDPLYQMLDANESVLLNRIARRVDEALTRGWSVIEHNGDLLRRLHAALAIRGQPAEAGVQSRNQNVRRDEAVRADEQAKMAAAGAAEGGKGQTTTTITTQTPGSDATPAGPKMTPGHGGHGKKTGK